MKEKQLKEIALFMFNKWYSSEDLYYCDDLYNATEEEKGECQSYFYDIQDIWTIEFKKQLSKLTK